MRRSDRYLVALLVATAVAATAAGASADPLTPFSGESQTVTVADVLPHFDENRENPNYSEWWSVVFNLEGGYWAYVQFIVSNVGLGKGKAAVTAEVSFPDGQKFSERTNLDPGQWSSGKDGFALKFGDNTMGGPLDGLTIRVKNPTFEAEYRLKNVAPPWKPGNGKAQYGSSASRYYQFQAIAPAAEVEGTVKLVDDDKVHKVKGIVYAEHSLASIGIHEQAKRWARFRTMNAKTVFLMYRLETPDVYGNVPVQFVVLFDGGRKVFDATAFETRFADFYKDPKKEGYQAPQLIEIKAESGGRKLHAAIKATKFTEREDYLETVSAAERFVISKFAKPIMYYFDGRYATEVTVDGKVQKIGGDGRYYFTVLNL